MKTTYIVRLGTGLLFLVLLAMAAGPSVRQAAGQEPPADPLPELLPEDRQWIDALSEELLSRLTVANPDADTGQQFAGFLVAEVTACLEQRLREIPGQRNGAAQGCVKETVIGSDDDAVRVPGDEVVGVTSGFGIILFGAIQAADTRVGLPIHPEDRAWAHERAAGLRDSLAQIIRETPDAPPEAAQAFDGLTAVFRDCLVGQLGVAGSVIGTGPFGAHFEQRVSDSERRTIEADCRNRLVQELESLPATPPATTDEPTPTETLPSVPPPMMGLAPPVVAAPMAQFPPPVVGQVPPAQPPSAPPDVMVTTDKPSYSIGETVTICIIASAEGNAQVFNVTGSRRTELREARIDGTGRGCVTARVEGPAGQQCAVVEFVSTSTGGRVTAQACFTVTEPNTMPASIISPSTAGPASPSTPRVSLDGNYIGAGTATSRTMPGFQPDAYVYVIRLRDWIGPTATQGPMTRAELRVDANGRVTGGRLTFEAGKTLGTGANARTDRVLFEGSAVPSSNVLINQDTTGISPGLVFGVIEFEGPAQYCVGVPLNSPSCQKTTTDVTLHYVFRAMGAQPTGELALCNALARETCESNLVGVLRNR